MNKNDFETAVGEAAQDAVWKTPHPLTHRLADDDQRREQYLREYQLSVGRQVLAAIENLRSGVRFHCLEGVQVRETFELKQLDEEEFEE